MKSLILLISNSHNRREPEVVKNNLYTPLNLVVDKNMVLLDVKHIFNHEIRLDLDLGYISCSKSP